jgi:hypothetical protein
VKRSALAAGASHDLFVKGWMLDAYEHFAADAVEHFTMLRALREAPDPDSDTPQAPTYVRAHLRNEVFNPDYGREAFNRGRAQVAEFLRKQPAPRLVSAIVPLGDEAEQTPSDAEHFFGRIMPSGPEGYLLAEAWTDGAVTTRAHHVETTRIWAHAPIAPEVAGIDHHSLREVETPDGGLSLKVVRLDCSAPCRSSDLQIFSEDPAPAPALRPTVFDDDRD